MRNPCSHDEKDLLLALHGSASLITWLDVKLRVWTCPSCRARMKEYNALSSSLALAFRNPSTRAPLGAIAPWRFGTSLSRLLIGFSFGLLLIVGVTLSTTAFRNRQSEAPPASCKPAKFHFIIGVTNLEKPKPDPSVAER